MAVQQRSKLLRRSRCVNKRKIAYPKKSGQVSAKKRYYGPTAEQPYLEEEELAFIMSEKLKAMQITKEAQEQIAEQTVGQFENPLYRKYRENRLTASLFGEVVRRRDSTPCHCLVKKILKGSSFQNDATAFGIRKEPVVRKKFGDELQLRVKEAGLFIDVQHGYLGASPDGLIDDENALIEIKCLKSVSDKGITLHEAADSMNICLKKQNDGSLSLKKTHHYFYQIQGQLNITGREKCYFVVYSGENNDLFIETITKDEEFWIKNMLPRLNLFYWECVLPEIARDRISSGLLCVDPAYILKARRKKEEKKQEIEKRKNYNTFEIF